MIAVILSYNSGDTLVTTVEAVRSQSRRPWAILVVDNGSKDGSPDRVRAIADGLVLLDRNRGVGAGHNAGWRAAIETNPLVAYVWALEHDTVPAWDCLERLLKAVEHGGISGHRVGAVVPRQRHPDDEVRPSPSHRTGLMLKEPVPYVAPRMTFNGTLIRVSVIREVGFLREDFFVGHEDREFAWRLTKAGYAVVHDPNAVVVHRNKGARRRGAPRSIMRDYYSARNELYLRREVRREPWALARLTSRSAFHAGRVLLRGDCRTARIHARFRALLDGARGDLGQKHYRFLDPRDAGA